MTTVSLECNNEILTEYKDTGIDENFSLKIDEKFRIFFSHYEKIRVMITQSTKSLAQFSEWSFLDTQTSLKRVQHYLKILFKNELFQKKIRDTGFERYIFSPF